MPSLTTTLEDAIHRAIGFANARRHELATLEHLLLALIDEPDAARVMRACSVDLAELRKTLTKFVDTSKEQWRWLGEGLGISDEALEQFQRAANIRDAFFVGGGKTPSAAFELKPLSMDASVRQFILDLEGQIVDYQHGPPQTSRLQWPGPDGPGRVRLVFVHKYGSRASINEEGPWAWFRVLDRSRRERSNQPELFRVTFSTSDMIADMSASFELRATSVRNPFNLDQLRQFSCPARL